MSFSSRIRSCYQIIHWPRNCWWNANYYSYYYSNDPSFYYCCYRRTLGTLSSLCMLIPLQEGVINMWDQVTWTLFASYWTCSKSAKKVGSLHSIVDPLTTAQEEKKIDGLVANNVQPFLYYLRGGNREVYEKRIFLISLLFIVILFPRSLPLISSSVRRLQLRLILAKRYGVGFFRARFTSNHFCHQTPTSISVHPVKVTFSLITKLSTSPLLSADWSCCWLFRWLDQVLRYRRESSRIVRRYIGKANAIYI